MINLTTANITDAAAAVADDDDDGGDTVMMSLKAQLSIVYNPFSAHATMAQFVSESSVMQRFGWSS